jgi:type IV secretion system protein VirB5
LELQARITAEQAMLQNENTKLMVLYHAAQAQELTRAQQARELSIANRGSLRTLPPIGLNP